MTMVFSFPAHRSSILTKVLIVLWLTTGTGWNARGRTPPVEASDRPAPPETSAPSHPALPDVDDLHRRLVELIERYLTVDDSEAREKTEKQIEQLADSDIAPVLKALAAARCWLPRTERTGTISIALDNHIETVIHWQIPQSYDPARAYPLVLLFDDDGVTMEQTLIRTAELLGADANQMLFARIMPLPDARYHLSDRLVNLVQVALRKLRRTFHTDPDRTFLIGFDSGCDAAWMTLLSLSDTFAGSVLKDGFPHLPCPEQMLKLLLPNLRGVTIAAGWQAPRNETLLDRSYTVANFNRFIARHAPQFEVKVLGIERKADETNHHEAFRSAVQRAMAARRPPAGKHVARWFRFDVESTAGFVGLAQLRDAPWRDDRIAVLAREPANRDRFATETLQSLLGAVRGRIEGNRITLDTHACGNLSLRLAPDSVDYTAPVTVACNGRVRHESRVTPSVRVLLRHALQSRDFTRPWVAELTFSIRTDRHP